MTVEELNVKVTADISDLKRDLARMEGAVKGSAKKSLSLIHISEPTRPY